MAVTEIARPDAATPYEPGFAGRFLRWCAKAYSAASEAEVIATMDERMISEIARDCSISPQDLVRLARAGPEAADEMLAMMRHLGIDPVEVLLQHPALFRDMQLRCAKCSAKSRCRRDLSNSNAGKQFGHYCGNSDELNAMRTQPNLMLD
jgi:hypothetical protein